MASNANAPYTTKSGTVTTTAKSQAAQDASNAAKASTKLGGGKSNDLPAGISYQTYNPDGSVALSMTSSQKHASDAADIANGKDTPVGIGGELTGQAVPTPVPSTPIAPPTSPTNTPVNTNQPSPSKVDATPYTNPAPSTPAPTPTQQAHAIATASGSPVPQNPGVGMSVANNAVKNASNNQGYTAPPPVVQAYTDATQKLTDDYNKAMTSQDQGKSLVDQYKQFTKDLGIPELNTQLMNMKNIIEGTEDDIRNEVTKSGGFATDSQVLAMTNARNKTMIQNYNNLLQTRSDMMQQVQTMVGLAAQDKTFLNQQIDRQLNFDQQQVQFAEKALTNAQSSIQKSIDTYGAASVLKQALATGDPTAVARINATMSASGTPFDLKQASLAPPSLDDQLKKAQISNIYSEINARNTPQEGVQTLTGKPQTTAQATANGFADRLGQANVTLNKIGGNFTSPLAIGGSLPTFLQSGDRQSYQQAKTNFVTAVLRQESGASIAPSEFKSAEATYFPVAGDNASTVAQKAATRNTVINNFYREANVTRPVFAGDVVQGNDGKQYKVGDDGVSLKPL